MVNKALDLTSQSAEKAVSGAINQMEHTVDDAAGGNQTESEKQLGQVAKKACRIAKEALMATEKVMSAWPTGSGNAAKEHIIGEE